MCKKLVKNKSIEEIADDLEEDVSTIEKICNVASKFAPEYDVDSIMEVLEKEALWIEDFLHNIKNKDK